MAADHLTWACEGDFLDHVVFIRTTHCWAWTGPARGGHGLLRYGGYYLGGENWYAHRLSYVMFNGPIPEGMLVCHRCDVPFCVNPAHLFLGDRLLNNRDRDRKNRHAKGCRHGQSKLTEAQALTIRARIANGEGQASIARDFGVHRATVNDIARRITWAHV
jgi:hypothetical protein